MQLEFYKYQGTGNDFVMIDNREQKVSKNNTNLIKILCDRKFGVGADGLILLEKSQQTFLDFEMLYFNADGKESSMCGNGGRCIVAFAYFLELCDKKTRFSAIDGLHEGCISDDGIISLKMANVAEILEKNSQFFLLTGSPHHVMFDSNVEKIDVKTEGARIRHSEIYKEIGGTNVNFVEYIGDNTLKVRTFERGVEDETLSCGTGVVAATLAAFANGMLEAKKPVYLFTKGGKLEVQFQEAEHSFFDIWLSAPAKMVFKGDIIC